MKVFLYVGMMLLTLYLGIMYRWQESTWLLSGEIVLPILCVGMAWLSRKKIQVRMEQQSDTAERGEEIPVGIHITNNGWIPAIVKVSVSCQHLSGSIKMKKQRIHIPPHNSENLNMHVTAKACGKLRIVVTKLQVYDGWGFTFVRKRCKEYREVMVMPKPYPMNLIVSNRTKWFPIDGESYAKDRSGDDTAEIYEVREYRAGDRLQKVHWKLSAKENDLYIKEFSYPLGAAVVLLLEAGRASESMETFLEVVVSFSTALLRLECPHYIAWQKKAEGQIRRMLIRDEEDFHEFLMELLRFEEKTLEKNAEEYYRYTYKNDHYSTLLRISTDLEIQINQDEIMQLKQQDLETFFETVEMVV